MTMTESKELGIRWGAAWVAAGLLSGLAAVMFTSRDGLLGLTFLYYLFSVAAVCYATRKVGPVLASLTLGIAFPVAMTGALIHFEVDPMAAVPLWLGTLAGTANLLAGPQLTLLALVGQWIPIALTAALNVVRHGLSPLAAGTALVIASAFCLVGSLLARLAAR